MAKMILRASAPSPFVRKVRIAAELAGLTDALVIEQADTMSPDDSVRKQNPLGKIPTLLLEDGTPLYDSRVIIEYLDDRAGGGKVIPRDGRARFDALKLQALADGMMEAAVLVIYEQRWRAEDKREPKWVAYQNDKIGRALAELERSPPSLSPIHIGQVAVACALGYLDFRHEGRWRAQHPKLVRWYADFAAAVPSFARTQPA